MGVVESSVDLEDVLSRRVRREKVEGKEVNCIHYVC